MDISRLFETVFIKSDQEKDIRLNKGRKETVNLRSQVAPSCYFRNKYDTKERFCSYWHQIQEILVLKPKKVLEIAIGNGFVSKYLKERGVDIATLYIDER